MLTMKGGVEHFFLASTLRCLGREISSTPLHDLHPNDHRNTHFQGWMRFSSDLCEANYKCKELCRGTKLFLRKKHAVPLSSNIMGVLLMISYVKKSG